MDVLQLKQIALERRRDIVRMDYASSAGHVGGALSCIDILVALYFDAMGEKDHFIQSKGHCAEALYSVLAEKGKIPKEELNTYCQAGSRLYGHPTVKVPGVEVCTGALGHGLPVALGMAKGLKASGGRVFVLLGDGEMAEGSNWEAIMAAAHYKLDNLVAVVDRNHLQISGNTEQVLAAGDMAARARAFGWAAADVDGHDMAALTKALKTLPLEAGKPTMLVARTMKGKGVSFMENDPHWHHGVMNAQQYATALRDLGVEE
ncbi:Transketolase 1 [uncultured Clostridium sp.]|nr:Transketolase 1 [uncultured Clostridium sp.]